MSDEWWEYEKRCFLSIPFSTEYIDVIECIRNVLHKFNIGCVHEEIYDFISEFDWHSEESQIRRNLLSCDLAIADITEANPNVLTEVGMLIQANKPIIFIFDGRKTSNVPAPLHAFIHFEYRAVKDIEIILNRELKKFVKPKQVLTVKSVVKPVIPDSEIISSWERIQIGKTVQSRGEGFVDFVQKLFESINGFEVSSRKKTEVGEFDLVVRNNKEGRPWSDLSYVFMVECKYTETGRKIDLKSINHFETKLRNDGLNGGFVITNSTFTEDAVKETKRALSRDRIVIGLVNSVDLEDILHSRKNFERILSDAYMRAFL